jgi:hypothetical protein
MKIFPLLKYLIPPSCMVSSLRKHYIILSILLSPVWAQAQYTGGSNDGANSAISNAQSLGENIFNGGNDDGAQVLIATGQSLGESIYTGGTNDGAVAEPASTQTLGESIYTGGENDGAVAKNSVAQPLGESIYVGGDNDGVAAQNSPNQSLGESIYTGGQNDGQVVGNSVAQSLGESIYGGGNNDGSVTLSTAMQSLGESIYQGGVNDGTALMEVGAQSLAENIFAGGNGMGFAMQIMMNAPLPVSLLSFSSKWQSTDAVCEWTMANESEVDGYVIEASTNGQKFDSISYTKAVGVAGKSNYAARDYDRWNLMGSQQVVHYRLKQFSKDGQFAYSALSTLYKFEGRNKGLEVSIYPNPTQEYIYISCKNETGPSSISIYDEAGKLVSQLKDTKAVSKVSLAGLAKGGYTLVLSSDTEILLRQRIILQ